MDSDEKDGRFVVGLAAAGDVDDIVALLQANGATRGGSLTVHFERAQVAGFVADMPVIVARSGARLAGVLISAPVGAVGDRPVIARMLDVYPGGDDAYVYGPICIAERHRGSGLVAMLFERLKSELPGREGILFVRRDNEASLDAHRRKLGMCQRGVFSLDGVDYVVLSYRAEPCRLGSP